MKNDYWGDMIEECAKQRRNREFKVILIRVLIIFAIMLIVLGLQSKKEEEINKPCQETLSINNCYILSTEPLYVKN